MGGAVGFEGGADAAGSVGSTGEVASCGEIVDCVAGISVGDKGFICCCDGFCEGIIVGAVASALCSDGG